MTNYSEDKEYDGRRFFRKGGHKPSVIHIKREHPRDNSFGDHIRMVGGWPVAYCSLALGGYAEVSPTEASIAKVCRTCLSSYYVSDDD